MATIYREIMLRKTCKKSKKNRDERTIKYIGEHESEILCNSAVEYLILIGQKGMINII